MNILVLSNCPVIETLGSGYIIYNTARSLREIGHVVDIIPPEKFKFLEKFSGRANNYRMAIGMAKWVITHKKKIAKYDLIIVYGAESAAGLFIIKSIFKFKKPVILHSNGLEVHSDYRISQYDSLTVGKKWYHRDHTWLFNYCYNNVTAIITLSDYDKNFAVKNMMLPESKIYSLEPAIPDIFFQENPNINLDKKKIITFCGTWVDRKGIESIKGSIPGILKKFPEYSFRLIGVGTDFKPENHFPLDVLDRIEVFPLVESKEELKQLYSESSIFLFPSLIESFGVVVAEALFCKCAVISGPTGLAATLINNKEAIILEFPNTLQVSIAIETLIVDKPLREKLSYFGHKRVENLNWNHYKSKLNTVVNKVTNNFN